MLLSANTAQITGYSYGKKINLKLTLTSYHIQNKKNKKKLKVDYKSKYY